MTVAQEWWHIKMAKQVGRGHNPSGIAGTCQVHDLHIHCHLPPTKHLTQEEQVAIFHRIAKTGLGSREHQERFQHSGDTISK